MTNHATHRTLFTRGLVPMLVACAAACSDDGEAGAPGIAGAGGSTGPGGATGSMFAAVVQVRGDVDETFVAMVQSLTSPDEIDIADAVPIPGRGIAVAPPTPNGAFYAMNGESPRLTRYTVGEDGSIEQGDTIAFETLFIPSFGLGPGHFVFVSETKAYLIDVAQVFVWDPTNMVIIDVLPLPELEDEEFLPLIGERAFFRGDTVIVSFGFGDAVRRVVAEEARVLFIDTTTDTVSSVASTETCSYLRFSWESSNGDLYFGTDVFATALELTTGPEASGESCVIRIAVGATEFDEQPAFDPRAFPGGAPAASFAGVGDTTGFVRVLESRSREPGRT